MSVHELRNHSRRRGTAQVVKATVGFMVIAALTYVAVVAVQHSPAAPDASWASASEVPMMNPKPLAGTADIHAARPTAKVATPDTSAQKAPGRDFDYFPDHYVNQATRIEEQPPTF
jgi:hypothetical protein